MIGGWGAGVKRAKGNCDAKARKKEIAIKSMQAKKRKREIAGKTTETNSNPIWTSIWMSSPNRWKAEFTLFILILTTCIQ